ncbi:hypothetical protein Taro_052792 [Colocasia esculenta]|uniref:Pentatricopeptide repeat-containing protein n=1 Tax=Colocasia esculenta TaxID=4460 RepID=A0A843XJA4_COLES|nr:hypothetical protein [Colocasia esculenta]
MRDAAAVAASLPPSFLRRDRIPTCCWTPHPGIPSHHHHENNSLVLVDGRHQARGLPCPTGGKLPTRGCSRPLRFLDEQKGSDHLCSRESSIVVRLLPEETGSTGDACQMFDVLASRELSQVTGADHSRIIRLLCEEGSVEEANRVLREMAELGLRPSLSVYDSVVHALAREGDFRGAWDAMGRMTETGLAAVPETYHGLIRAYGKARMYDEVSKCVKAMASTGCSPNEVTYNILIVEYARGGLLERMEGAHRTLLSKRMRLLPSTLVVMLETYADLGVVAKMEKAYRNCLRSKAHLKESLVRKLALVYIKHLRFARLEELGNEVATRTGRVLLVWCLLLLCSALLSSQKGMESIAREMRIAQVSPRITFTNIMASAHAKMKNYRDLNLLLSQIGASGIRPDLVTVGILFDACANGFDGTRVLDVWRKHRFLERRAEMDTDPLVVAAFGKGPFLLRCEEQFSAVGPEVRGKRAAWTYVDLIRLVFTL